MPDTITGWVPDPAETSEPNCSKPVPFSWVAVTRNCWPDTETLAAIAPWAVRPTRVAAIAPAGTRMTASRFHLTRPAADADVRCLATMTLSLPVPAWAALFPISSAAARTLSCLPGRHAACRAHLGSALATVTHLGNSHKLRASKVDVQRFGAIGCVVKNLQSLPVSSETSFQLLRTRQYPLRDGR